jgi:hypothetical protein
MDGNSKIAVGRPFEDPAPNAFSTLSIEDCPYSTPTCRRECYTASLKKFVPELFEKYRHNSYTIRQIVSSGRTSPTWSLCVGAFSRHAKMYASKGFRWSVSGDVFSEAYAQFIFDVARAAPEVLFWIYTRSFGWVPELVGLSNLVVNLSADADNWEDAQKCQAENPGTRICYMTVDGEVPELQTGSIIFPSYPLRGRDLPNPTDAPWWGALNTEKRRMVCPPDFFGQSENLRCGPCRKCLDQPSDLVQLGTGGQ